jgi:hypothetical protein
VLGGWGGGLAIFGVATETEANVQKAYSFQKAMRILVTVSGTPERMTGVAVAVIVMAVERRIWRVNPLTGENERLTALMLMRHAVERQN